MDHDVRGGERGGGVAVGDVVPLEYLVGACVGGGHRVEDGLERLGIDEDGLGAVGRRGFRACDDQGDRLAREHGDVPCQRHGEPPIAPATTPKSFAVRTATTPGTARAAEASMERSRACAYTDGTIRAWRSPAGADWSAAKRAVPVTLASESARGRETPITR